MTDDMQFARVYYARGAMPRNASGRYAISDPPTSGWSHAILIRGGKRTTLLCPFTLKSYQVGNNCSEVEGAMPVEIADTRLAEMLTEAWERMVGFGFQRSYDIAAVALNKLGAPIPRVQPPAIDGHEGPRKTGGKEPNPLAVRPVRAGSKRGRVAEFFLSDEPQSLREAMAVLDLSRSGVLSHLFCLHRDHGLGYELASDCARLLVPEGFDVFAVPSVSEGDTEDTKAARNSKKAAGPLGRKPAGKPLDISRLTPVPEPSKRATVAQAFLEWATLEEQQEALGLSRSAILSHMFTLNKDHGLGYEVSEDGKQARLIYPEGHVVFGPKPERTKKKKKKEGEAKAHEVSHTGDEISDDEDWLN